MPENPLLMPTGLPLQFPSAFAAFHHHATPLPVDQRTHEGRYVWDPSGRGIHPAAFPHHAAHG
jgi:hypothetical protein